MRGPAPAADSKPAVAGAPEKLLGHAEGVKGQAAHRNQPHRAARLFFTRTTSLSGESTVSSGKKGFETGPPGTYKVIQKAKAHFSNLYGE